MGVRRSRPDSRNSISAGVLPLVLALTCALAAVLAPPARAADYKMLLCAGNNGSNSYATSTNTTSPSNPGGIFTFANHCGPAPDPAGSAAFLTIYEHEQSGNAGVDAYGDISYEVPPWVAILAAGGYTREPNDFNQGWRARFWGENFDGTGFQILTQGAGLSNSGEQAAPTSVFTPHLWPFGTYGYFRRFVFELECVRPAGCERSGVNEVDANTFVLILADVSPPAVGFDSSSSPLLAGDWVKGNQPVEWGSSDQGSGLRDERLSVDGAQRKEVSYAGECDTGSSQVDGEFARVFSPCPTGGPYQGSYVLETAGLSDGTHNVKICAQDFSQFQALGATPEETCEQRTIRTDNTPPGIPVGLSVTSSNPARYLSHFGAQFSLPPNQGSPIAAVHYEVINAAGEVVVPEQTYSAINPTEVPKIEGPSQPGDYRLRLWLEDQVGFEGPPATTQIPHDTTPPAAPQDLSVTPPGTPRSVEGFDLRWHDITDAGSPIDAAHYEVFDSAGNVVVPEQTVSGEGIQAIKDLETPPGRGEYTLRLWLEDEEGNVGAPVSAPLAYDCVRSEVPGGLTLTAAFGGASSETVQQGGGGVLSGALHGAGGGVANAPLCVFSRVLSGSEREFEGIALSGSGGDYRFPVAPGPSRQLSVIYRPDQRELSATATLQTVVHPTLRARPTLVRNKHFVYFEGQVPGPDNDHVVVVLQAMVGRHWRTFRRYSTRDDGRFVLGYRFSSTFYPTTYRFRAQVRETVGYPYLEGNSHQLALRVLP